MKSRLKGLEALYEEIVGSPPQQPMSKELKEVFAQVVSDLPPRCALALRKIYFEGQAISEIAPNFPKHKEGVGVTRARVVQLADKGIGLLRGPKYFPQILSLLEFMLTGEKWAELLSANSRLAYLTLREKEQKPLTSEQAANIIMAALLKDKPLI